MTNVDLDALEVRARSVYERGRWRWGVFAAWPALVVAGICGALGGRPLVTLLTGVVLAAVIAIAIHRGRAASRAVVPGLLAGALPLMVGLASCRVPHACAAGFCVAWCVPACLVAGAIAGLLLAVRVHRVSLDQRPSMLVATGIAVLAGSLGCLVVGLGGVIGMFLGLSVGATAAMVPRLRRC